MACCKCCCGGVDCTEGQEGKCCCGGFYGECCQVGEYCCSGVCQAEPCGDTCCGFAPENCTLTVTVTGGGAGTYEWDFATSSWVGTAPSGSVSFDTATCEVTYSASDTPYVGSCNSWSASATATVLCSECCGDNTGVGCSLGATTFTSSQDTDCTGVIPTNITLSLSCDSVSCCGGPCQWVPVWLNDGTWAGGWELLAGYCNDGCACGEPTVEDVGTEAYPYQTEPYETPCSAIGMAMEAESGPGAELKSLLGHLGIKTTPSCPCNQRAKVMNARGCDWCEANIETISGWLEEEAKRRKLPYVHAAGKLLIRLAIRRARKKGTNQ